MATVDAREFKTRFHSNPLFYAVTEADTVPRSAKHAERMTEVEKAQMARNKALFAEKVAAIAAKEKEDAKRDSELATRTIERETARLATIKADAEDKAQCEKDGVLYKDADSKYVLVVRIKGTNKLPPKPRKTLALLRLRQVNNAVFVKVNKDTNNMLKHILPWITYGEPSVELVRDLVYKRGYVRTGYMGHQSRTRLQSNDVVGEYLGKYNIQGVEDMIHEITTCGPNFTQVNRFFHPFKLNMPTGGFANTKKHAVTEMRGGEAGNRGKHIDALVSRMI